MAKYVLLLLATCSTLANATTVHLLNLCKDSMTLYSSTAITGSTSSQLIKAGSSVTLEIADSNNAAYRYGSSYQATQAEFSNVDSRTWYDISIIPAGGTGPGSCSSLEDCKATTGGVGFNVPMQIVPSDGGGLSSPDSCRVLSCLEDGCDDAYQFPDQDSRTHSCGAYVEFQVIFCASNATESSSDSAADFWVDIGSSRASGSDSKINEASGVNGSESADTMVKSQSDPGQIPSTDSSGALPTKNQSADSSSSSSTAIYVSTSLVGAVIVIVGAILVYRHRQVIVSWWETKELRERSSSDMLVFVEAKDDVAMM